MQYRNMQDKCICKKKLQGEKKEKRKKRKERKQLIKSPTKGRNVSHMCVTKINLLNQPKSKRRQKKRLKKKTGKTHTKKQKQIVLTDREFTKKDLTLSEFKSFTVNQLTKLINNL